MKSIKELKFSVLLCTYNGENYIAAQLKSIVNQSRAVEEVIICDDGSTDNTVKIVKDFIRHHPNIQLYVNKSNLGYIKNFIQGFNKISGNWVFLCDQDDIWFENRVQIFEEAIKKNFHKVCFYSDGLILTQDTLSIGESIFTTRKNADLAKGAQRHIEEAIKGIDIKGCSMVVYKEYLDKLQFPIVNEENYNKFSPQIWGHDHWIAINAFIIQKLHVINQPTFYYRIHLGNTSGDMYYKKFSLSNFKKKIYSFIHSVFENDSIYRNHRRYKVLLESTQKDLIKSFLTDDYTFTMNCISEIDRLYKYYSFRIEIHKSKGIKRLFKMLKGIKNNSYDKSPNMVSTFLKDLIF